ncbi:hypothetical protein Dda_3922 [Drechslerella dactyloides]|uniref:HhH-GPD domain-containing protein n=1 Tax=Drechslerella dactyloides TaxID=74499 RepID=A0AAD6IYT3_DREDA|nr:hypothetical protein Dda_3922 [Drechslerella dactyloides]
MNRVPILVKGIVRQIPVQLAAASISDVASSSVDGWPRMRSICRDLTSCSAIFAKDARARVCRFTTAPISQRGGIKMTRQLRSMTKKAAASTAEPQSPSAQTPPSHMHSRKRKNPPPDDTSNTHTKTPRKPVKAKSKPTNSKSSKATPPKRPKKAPNITLGQSPFPSHPFPTPAQCATVHTLLTRAHGPAVRPTTIPTASTVHAGCGEVPSVLDALMRTILSANTSASNSSGAFRSLLDTYGADASHGGVNWEAVRVAGVKKLYATIEAGGLANIKSRAMQDILDEVYERGVATGAGLSLDYLHEKSDEEAMRVLTGFKGVGVKTATCVLMFCLRRSAFPVDTHVFRISKLLGWLPTPGYEREVMERESKIAPLEVDEGDDEEKSNILVGESTSPIPTSENPTERRKRPPPVTRDTAFLHLDARVPPELKYGLHQLMIRHGRYCPTCNAAGGRKYGIGQNGKPLAVTTKRVTVKEEQSDGTFAETQVEISVKEEPADSEHEDGGSGSLTGFGAGSLSRSDRKIKLEENGEGGVKGGYENSGQMLEASESESKPYVPIDAAGGTGEKTGGNPDGSCILGDSISWERLV